MTTPRSAAPRLAGLALAASLLATPLVAAAQNAAPYDYEYLTVHADERAKTQNNVETLGQIFEAIFARDWDRMRELYADNYVQHNPEMNDGKEGVIELFSALNYDEMIYEPTLSIAEGPYVVALSKFQFAADQPLIKVVDINFIRDGQSREHWDIIVPVDDPEKFFSVAMENEPQDQATIDANKALVAEFVNVVFNQKNFDRIGDFVGDPYVQHSSGEDGAEALRADVEERFADAEVDIKRIVAQDDLVLAHSRVTLNASDFSRVDIWRVRDGAMVEHWGLMQPVPDEMAHRNGMF